MKLEFSKIIVFFMLLITIGWVSTSYFLAFFGKDPNEIVTVTVISTLMVTLISYYVSKTTEKMSRNKYGIDKNGNPFCNNNNNNKKSSD